MTKPENEMQIEQLNLIKSQVNQTVSNLVEINKVRITIGGIFTKKTEPHGQMRFIHLKKL